MKINRNRLIAYSLGLLAGMSSCGSNNNEEPANVLVATSAPSISHVTDASGSASLLPGATYQVVYNEDNKTAVVRIADVRWAAGQSAGNYVISDVPWKFNPSDKSRVISVERLTPDGADRPVFTDLDIVYYPENDAFSTPATGMAVSCEIDGAYELTNIPVHTLFAGSTETVNFTAPESSAFVSTVTTYAVDLDVQAGTATLKITNASFAPEMPRLNMEFGPLAVTFDDDGFVLASDALVPTIGGTPYPRFEVSRLRMEVELDGRSELKFRCMTYDVDAVFYGSYSPAE